MNNPNDDLTCGWVKHAGDPTIQQGDMVAFSPGDGAEYGRVIVVSGRGWGKRTRAAEIADAYAKQVELLPKGSKVIEQETVAGYPITTYLPPRDHWMKRLFLRGKR